MRKAVRRLGLGLALAVVSVPASAATFFNLSGPSTTRAIDTNPAGRLTYQFNAPAEAANISFQVQAFGSVDGSGTTAIDTFSLLLNNSLIMAGTFNLGGTGANVINALPNGATWSTSLTGSGGLLNVTLPANLFSGRNTLLFQYKPRNGFGETGESWRLNSLSVASVPEPSTWAMMLIGFGGIGFAMRRAKKANAKLAIA